MLQLPRAALHHEFAAGLARGVWERGDSVGGMGQAGNRTKPASHSTSFRKATGVVGDLTAMHPKMGEGGRVGRFIPKVHS